MRTRRLPPLLLAAALACANPTGPSLSSEVLLYHNFTDGGLHLIDGDGTNDRTLWSSATEGATMPSWAPDGSAVAFQTLDANQIVVIDVHTRVLHTISSGSDVYVSPMWAPDGHRIAYLYGTRTDSDGFGVLIHDLATGVTDTLARAGFIADRGAWTPDGTTLLLINIDGESVLLNTMTHGETQGPAWNLSYRGPAYSPDGQLIAYSCQPAGTPSICVMNHDGSGARQLTPTRAGGFDTGEGYPVWVPHQQLITFHRYSPGPTPGLVDAEIILIDLAGHRVAWPERRSVKGDLPQWRPH